MGVRWVLLVFPICGIWGCGQVYRISPYDQFKAESRHAIDAGDVAAYFVDRANIEFDTLRRLRERLAYGVESGEFPLVPTISRSTKKVEAAAQKELVQLHRDWTELASQPTDGRSACLRALGIAYRASQLSAKVSLCRDILLEWMEAHEIKRDRLPVTPDLNRDSETSSV